MKNQTKGQCERIIVLDTSAFLAGFDPFSHNEDLITVPKIEEEIRKNFMIKMRFETAIESGKVKVKAPSQAALDLAKASADKAGDWFKLSEADMQLLALAIELKKEGYLPQIVTDDYSIQNVATRLEIEFVALATFGIKRLLVWIRYCPACYREYQANYISKECQVCGTELKRKTRRTTKR